ncbi:MAG: enoyl-CoA hydratase/isomerase family protein [Acidobacteriaceae bacterium]|nr:enoyl-CoA hydratase/isomerase family protein [Acidobacteriaceae bacterium]
MKILITHKHRVLHLTLNRPDKRNALDAEMCRTLFKEVSEAQDRKDVGAILISALGTVFCAGMDLDEARGPNEADLTAAHEALFTMGANTVKPIVISVNGAALGGGLGLVAQGHVVLAAEGATLGLPEIKIGLWPFLVYRSVEAAIGPHRTLMLSLTGGLFQSQQAMGWGLIHQCSPGEELEDRSKAMARDLAKASPVAIAAGMQYFRQARHMQWAEAGELAAELRTKVMASEDFIEGCLAFKERREPRWPSMPANFYQKNKLVS